jgi:hypothetical protein
MLCIGQGEAQRKPRNRKINQMNIEQILIAANVAILGFVAIRLTLKILSK